jgi:hypothetical protein
LKWYAYLSTHSVSKITVVAIKMLSFSNKDFAFLNCGWSSPVNRIFCKTFVRKIFGLLEKINNFSTITSGVDGEQIAVYRKGRAKWGLISASAH